jgi:hypothetical protein
MVSCDELAGHERGPERRAPAVSDRDVRDDDRQAQRAEPEGEFSVQDDGAKAVVSGLAAQKAAYAHGAHRPLGAYAAISSGYALFVAGLVWLARRRDARSPAELRLDDLALATVATAKLSRIIAKDPVTSPLRAPFTRYKGRSGEAELAEEVRGTGVRHALGELVTCPFCVGQWVATSFGAGFVLAPGAARLAAAVGTTIAGADVLQYAFGALQQVWQRTSS